MNPIITALVIVAIVWVLIVLLGHLPLWLLALLVILLIIGFVA